MDDKLVPSVVSIAPNGEVVVGNPARELLITQPERTVYSVKRLMGRGLEDVAGRVEAVPVPHRARQRIGDPAPAGRSHVHAARDLGDRSAPIEAECRRLFRRAGGQGRDHGPGLLQRCPAAGHQGRRTHRRPGSPAPGQRTDRRRARLWARTSARTASSRFTIWAAARSISRS